MITIEKLERIANRYNVDINNRRYTDNKVALFSNGTVGVVMYDCDSTLNNVIRFVPFTLEAFTTAYKQKQFAIWIDNHI